MDKIIDFSKARRIIRPYGGTDQKIAVVYDEKVYMIKFPQFHAKRSDMSTSYINSVVSEYICSHIAESIGLDVHKTLLGLFGDSTDVDEKAVVVACEDFREKGDSNIEFSEYLRAEFRTDQYNKVLRLDQIYQTLGDRNYFTEELEHESIQRYWDTFVVDALVGNFDRHPGNWGYLLNNEQVRLAPLYDFGSCLLPTLSDEGMESLMNNNLKLLERCYVFPSPFLYVSMEKVGKVGYYDMLSSNYDHNCSEALLRIAPRIDMNKIYKIIEDTPLITPIRKQFYQKYLGMRMHYVVEKAYKRCKEGNYDEAALIRVKSGKSFSNKLLQTLYSKGELT